MNLTYLTNNKFWVGPCEERTVQITEDESYDGYMVSLISHEDENFKLLFPLRERDAQILKSISTEQMEVKPIEDCDPDFIGLYFTMIESWKTSDRILSGATLDSLIDPELGVEVFLTHFFLTNREGYIESMVKSNFSQIIILSALEDSPIFVSDNLIQKLIGKPISNPQGDNKSPYGDSDFIDDDAQNIIKIAQDIISGNKEAPDTPKKKRQPRKTKKKDEKDENDD